MDADTSQKVVKMLLGEVDRLKTVSAKTNSPVFPKLLHPGRLGDVSVCLKTDPRVDPRILPFLASGALDGEAAPPPVHGASSKEDLLAFMAEAEKGFGGLFAAWSADLGEIDGIARSEETIKGVDGNDIKLFISKPADATGKLPCLVHTHGGGMCIAVAADGNYCRQRDHLAKTGVVVVGVEFRNSAGSLGNHEFPAGLNDCCSAIEWAAANNEKLGTTDVLVVEGESGGGNLALATTMKLMQDGKGDIVKGTYACCPFIAGPVAYHDVGAADPADECPELLSIHENKSYFISNELAASFGRCYDHSGKNDRNPLAWPYWASDAECKGLPPTVISVNELDPLRDEGRFHYHKLLRAGVQARCRMVMGTVHAADQIFEAAIPDVYHATVADTKFFIDSLAGKTAAPLPKSAGYSST
jgi:acetyl esterase/lipase